MHQVESRLKLEAKRSYKDNYWHIRLKRGDDQYGHSRDDPVLSGARAVQLAELTLLRGTLPDPQPHMDDVPASLAEFQALCDQVHDRQRRLRFLCEALDVQPRAAAPA